MPTLRGPKSGKLIGDDVKALRSGGRRIRLNWQAGFFSTASNAAGSLRHLHFTNGPARVIGLPSTFTLDACRHCGMTELEEAELADGPGRALSAHKSYRSCEGCAERTMNASARRNLQVAGHLLADEARLDVQNGGRNDV